MRMKKPHRRLLLRSFLMLSFLILMIGGALALGQDTKNQKNSSDEPTALAGCESKEVKSGGKGAQERFYAAPLPRVKDALTSALAALEFDVSKDKDNTIEAHKRRHIGVVVSSGGEKII